MQTMIDGIKREVKRTLALSAFLLSNTGHAVTNGRPLAIEEAVAANTVLIACIAKVGAAAPPCFGDSGAPIYLVENGKPLLIGIQTQVQTNLRGRAYCDAPVIGMRGDGYIDEMRLIEEALEAAR